MNNFPNPNCISGYYKYKRLEWRFTCIFLRGWRRGRGIFRSLQYALMKAQCSNLKLLTGLLVLWLACWLSVWYTARLTVWLTHSLTQWLTDSLTDRFIGIKVPIWIRNEKQIKVQDPFINYVWRYSPIIISMICLHSVYTFWCVESSTLHNYWQNWNYIAGMQWDLTKTKIPILTHF